MLKTTGWILMQLCLGTLVCVAEFTAEPQRAVRIPVVQDLNEEILYPLFDWGDGVWTPGSLKRSGIHAFMEYRYAQPGRYVGRYTAVSVSGQRGEWIPFEVLVEGPSQPRKAPFASRCAWSSRGAEAYWERDACELHLDALYALDQLSVVKAEGKPFPTHFRIEYSVNGGRTWHLLNSAQFFFFPDPGENEVVVSFNGIAANAVRLLVTRRAPGEAVHLGGMTLTGSDELLFDGSARDPFLAGLNNLYLAYGSAINEVHLDHHSWGQSKRPFESGVSYMGNAEWMAWDALQFSWTDARELGELRDKWLNYPLDPDGFVWACPADPRHLFHSRHYDNNAFYINGIVHYVLQTGDQAFLDHTCTTTGRTNLEKLRLAMRYQLEQLGGREGVLTITDPEVDGTASSLGGNYWDYYKFGYRSAFDNAEFYASLHSMARMERFFGNETDAAEYERIAERVRTVYNELFWSEETGRYIGWIDVEGVRHDYGLTFVNLHALAHGLACPDRAESVLSWLDGTRVIDGETSTGDDIYHFRIGPRSNTIDMTHAPEMVETWGGAMRPDVEGAYGTQIQNGGVIFYISYYDLKARLRYRGIDDAMKRLRIIMDEFEIDEIRRMDSNPVGHTLILGILLCFPESGLVPMFYVDGILGIRPGHDGLVIAPNLPPEWERASVTRYRFRGEEYSVRVDRTVEKPRIDGREIIVPAEGEFVLTTEGTVQSRTTPNGRN